MAAEADLELNVELKWHEKVDSEFTRKLLTLLYSLQKKVRNSRSTICFFARCFTINF